MKPRFFAAVLPLLFVALAMYSGVAMVRPATFTTPNVTLNATSTTATTMTSSTTTSTTSTTTSTTSTSSTTTSPTTPASNATTPETGFNNASANDGISLLVANGIIHTTDSQIPQAENYTSINNATRVNYSTLNYALAVLDAQKFNVTEINVTAPYGTVKTAGRYAGAGSTVYMLSPMFKKNITIYYVKVEKETPNIGIKVGNSFVNSSTGNITYMFSPYIKNGNKLTLLNSYALNATIFGKIKQNNTLTYTYSLYIGHSLVKSGALNAGSFNMSFNYSDIPLTEPSIITIETTGNSNYTTVDPTIYYTPSNAVLTISTNTVLSSDLICGSVTINSGVTLSTDGYSIICNGTVTNDGIVASNNVANGGVGAGTNGGSYTLSYGGSGGGGACNGGNGSPGSTPTQPAMTNGNIDTWYAGGFVNYLSGAGGGGSGSDGGGGGYGIYIQGNTIKAGSIYSLGQNSASTTSTHNAGGSGGNTKINGGSGCSTTNGAPKSSSGGGGGGGVIMLSYGTGGLTVGTYTYAGGPAGSATKLGGKGGNGAVDTNSYGTNAPIVVIPLLSVPTISPTTQTGVVAGTGSVTISTTFGGGVSPYTINYIIVNTITGTQVANQLYTGVTGTSNSFVWSPAASLVGNTVQANVIVSDSASPKQQYNSIKSGTIGIEGQASVTLSPSNTILDSGQYVTYTANPTNGISPYTLNFFNVTGGKSAYVIGYQGWVATTSYPYSVYGQRCITYSNSITGTNNIYCVGGYAYDSAFEPLVYYAPILTSGGLGSWQPTNSYRFGLVYHTCNLYSSSIYCIGGESISILPYDYYAPILSTGVVGSWSFTGNYGIYPSEPGINLQSCQINSNNIYCMAGQDSAASPYDTDLDYYAPILSDGTIGTWTSANTYPANVDSLSCADSSNTIYCIGGNQRKPSGGFANVITAAYYAPIFTSGELGSWQPTNAYPTNIMGQRCEIDSNTIYCVAGSQDSTGTSINVYYAPILSSGGIGSWQHTVPYPVSVEYQSCTLNAHNLYCIGGFNNTASRSDVYYAPLTSLGVSNSPTWTFIASSPTTNNNFQYNVIVTDSYGLVFSSTTNTITVNPAMSAPSITTPAPSTQPTGNTLTWTTGFTGGSSPYTYNWNVYNTITGTILANMLETNSLTGNTFSWTIPSNMVGNTVNANVIVTDSATTSVTLNSVLSGTITITQTSCTFSISNSIINFGSINSGTQLATSGASWNSIKIQNIGSLASNVYLSGSDWAFGSNSFYVSNTVWSWASGVSWASANGLKATQTDSLVQLTGGASKNVYFGAGVPSDQTGSGSGSYSQTIDIISSC